MNETYVHCPNNIQLRVQVDSIGAVAGIGRHRLVVFTSLSPANEQADGVAFTLSGEAFADNLGGGSGYLGQIVPTLAQTLRRDGNFQFTLYVDITDDQVRKIEEHRNQPDGGFSLRLGLRLDGTDRDGNPISNTFTLDTVRVSREDWLNMLRQVRYRRVVIAELEVPDASGQPRLSSALDYYQRAQGRFEAGDYRGTAESIRQALSALMGEPPDVELDTDAMAAELRDAKKRQGGYTDRMELVRKVLKFTADLGAHPETDETKKAEALAQLHMAAGVMQWYASRHS